MANKPLTNRVAVVSGGASGIGIAVSHELAQRGALVAITDTIEEDEQQIVEQINSGEGSAMYWEMDPTDNDAVARTFTFVGNTLGKIDVLVNCHGVDQLLDPKAPTDPKLWNHLVNEQALASLNCTENVIKYMRSSRSGSIINISSDINPQATDPALEDSKQMVRMMSINTAQRYARYNVRVNTVNPKFIWSANSANGSANGNGNGIENATVVDQVKPPLGRFGEPQDLARTISFLASDDAKFITGSELNVDGGYALTQNIAS